MLALSSNAGGRSPDVFLAIYDAFFVPALFGQFPGQVLGRARVKAGARVVDVGCGTGIAAIAANSEAASV